MACRTKFAIGIVLSALSGVPIRLLHIYYSRHVMAVPLLLVEVFTLGFGVAANVFGSMSMMRHLDAREPKLLMSSLWPGQWWKTTMRPFISFRFFRRKHLIPHLFSWIPVAKFEKYREGPIDETTKVKRGRSRTRKQR